MGGCRLKRRAQRPFYYFSTNRDRPFVNRDRPAWNRDQPAWNQDRPARNRDRPARNRDRPVRNRDRPARNRDRPAKTRLPYQKSRPPCYKLRFIFPCSYRPCVCVIVSLCAYLCVCTLCVCARVSDTVWYWPDSVPTSQDIQVSDPDPTSQDKPDPDPWIFKDRIRIQTPLSWKFSIYFMMSFDKKLLPFSFFDGP